MKLKQLLLEKRTKLAEKKLSADRNIKGILQDLKSSPGMHVIEKLQDALDMSGVDMIGQSELYDDIQAAYKKVDAQVAKMIEMAIADSDFEMVQEKNKQLETIKGHVDAIQGKLQKEVKKVKKKK